MIKTLNRLSQYKKRSNFSCSGPLWKITTVSMGANFE